MDRGGGGHGVVPGGVELGVGRGRDAVRAAGAGGRSDVADCGVLSRADHPHGRDGVGVGCGGVGGDEVFSACDDGGGVVWGDRGVWEGEGGFGRGALD